MGSQEARIVADFLIADFENEMQTTMCVIAAVPNDHLYFPDRTRSPRPVYCRIHHPHDQWSAELHR